MSCAEPCPAWEQQEGRVWGSLRVLQEGRDSRWASLVTLWRDLGRVAGAPPGSVSQRAFELNDVGHMGQINSTKNNPQNSLSGKGKGRAFSV